MRVLNVFYSAFLGIWVTLSFYEIIETKWLSFVGIALILMIAFGLSHYTTLLREGQARLFFLILLISTSVFFPSLIIQLAYEPEISLFSYIAQPKTWFFPFVVAAWVLSLEIHKEEAENAR